MTVSLVIILVIVLAIIPFHTLLITTLIRYRKANDLKSPFFRLLLSLSVNDVCCCSLWAPFFIFIWVTDIWRTSPRFSATVSTAITTAFYGGNEVVVTAIALNRFVNLVFPLKAMTIWKSHYTTVAIAIQWTVNAVYTIPFALPAFQVVYNTTAEWEFAPVYHPVEEANQYWIILIWISLIEYGLFWPIILILYGICLIKSIKYKMTTHVQSFNENNGYSMEMKIALQGFLLTSPMIGMSATTQIATFKGVWYGRFAAVCYFANFVLDPLVALAFSKPLRKHAKKMFKSSVHPNQEKKADP